MLRVLFDVPLREYLRYRQIRHFFNSHFGLMPSSPISFFERISRDSPRGRGLISDLYHQFLICLFHTPPLYRKNGRRIVVSLFQMRIGIPWWITYARVIDLFLFVRWPLRF
ncbi:unnamed protein product [Staurois parvus]|uniref:Maturase K n=1 Tax=Staurois parvus TaxID=386267 RepID=A0ABN9C410_9NEOB|nr:unnamed protein product [Staurois parvus]